MAYLLTDSKLLIAVLFGFVIVAFGIEAGGNPLVVIPKVLLGRAEGKHLRDMLIVQNLGMLSALALYYGLVKLSIIPKHPLDKI
jgi:hypothetical protein